MKLTLYTCIVCPTQVLRCFPLDTLILMFMFVCLFFVFFLSLVSGISLRQSVSTFYETEYLTIFFCLLLICIYVHIHTRVKIYASFSHTQYNLCIVPQQKYPQKTCPPRPPLQHPTGLYNVNMYSTHTLTHTQQKENKKGGEINTFLKRAVPFLPSALEIKERGRRVRW